MFYRTMVPIEWLRLSGFDQTAFGDRLGEEAGLGKRFPGLETATVQKANRSVVADDDV